MSVTISETADVDTCLALRRVVFILEQGVSEADELDAFDATALHLLALDGDIPVGTARIVFAANIGKIGRVCVLKSHRGTGLGAALIRAALESLEAEIGITHARLGAQTYALGFYEKLGFTAFGDEYLDAGIPHFAMDRPI